MSSQASSGIQRRKLEISNSVNMPKNINDRTRNAVCATHHQTVCCLINCCLNVCLSNESGPKVVVDNVEHAPNLDAEKSVCTLRTDLKTIEDRHPIEFASLQCLHSIGKLSRSANCLKIPLHVHVHVRGKHPGFCVLMWKSINAAIGLVVSHISYRFLSYRLSLISLYRILVRLVRSTVGLAPREIRSLHTSRGPSPRLGGEAYIRLIDRPRSDLRPCRGGTCRYPDDPKQQPVKSCATFLVARVHVLYQVEERVQQDPMSLGCGLSDSYQTCRMHPKSCVFV